MADEAAAADAADAGGDVAPAGEQGSEASASSKSADSAAPQGEAAASGDWRAALPDDLREAKALSDVGDVASLAKQFVDQQSYLGNAVRIPSEHASDEDRAAFLSRLREVAPNLREVDPASVAPDDVSGYTPPELDGIQLDPGMTQAYTEWAHEAGLSQAQYDRMLRSYVDNEQRMAQAQAEEQKAEYAALREEWGDAYDEKVRAAQRVATLSDAPPDLQKAIMDQKVRPDLMRWLADLSASLGDEGRVAELHTGPVEITPAEAQAQIDEIMNNREHPYWSAAPGSPEKTRAIEELMALRAKVHGKEGSRPHVVLGGFDEDQEVRGGTLFAGHVR